MKVKNILRKPFSYVHYNFTLYIIALNLAVFLITQMSRNIVYYLSMIPGLVNQGFVWQFITYMFVHGNFNHIFFNMLGLFIFGSQIEQQMGSWEFLSFYMITGVLAGILSYVIYMVVGQQVALMGASGALYAVMLAFATYFPDARIFVMGILPMRSVTLVLLYGGIALFNQFFGYRSGVAHMAHLGGFGFAFLYFLVRFGKNPVDAWKLRR